MGNLQMELAVVHCSPHVGMSVCPGEAGNPNVREQLEEDKVTSGCGQPMHMTVSARWVNRPGDDRSENDPSWCLVLYEHHSRFSQSKISHCYLVFFIQFCTLCTYSFSVYTAASKYTLHTRH